MHAVHRCGLLLQMTHIAWYVRLSVCVLVTMMSCKNTAKLIGMPFDGRADLLAQGTMYWGSDHPTAMCYFGVVRPSDRHWESLLRCTQQNGSFNPQ